MRGLFDGKLFSSNLTSAVVGVASTSYSAKTDKILKDRIRFADGIGVGSEKILELDSMDPLSNNNLISNRYTGIGTVTKWYDTGFPQNNATFYGNYSFDGRNIVFADTGYAALDDGSDFDFAGDFAIEVSFIMTGTPSAVFPSALIASWNNLGSSDNKFIIYIGSLVIVLGINGESNTWTYPETISLNTNYHTIVTRRDGVIKWWLDGKLGSEITYAAAIEPTLGYQIGTYAASSGQAFEGGINLVRMYRDRSLSDMEVRSLYDQQINRTLITETNGTKRLDNYNLNLHCCSAAENRPVQGQLYPRFTK